LEKCSFSPETQKGGKISPAARRFPLSPRWEAVKPPLFVPVFRDRLLDVWEFFIPDYGLQNTA